MADCTAYIDESGDLGINCGGTRWFVLSAVIVDKSDEAAIRKKMERIKSRLNVKEIHLRRIRDFYKAAYIVRELNGEKFTYMNILVDTNKFDRSKIPNPQIAYNYVCKFLLERVSACLKEQGRTADIVLSARGTSRDGELIQYIEEKLLPYPSNSIDETRFEDVAAKAAASWDMLQLADVCATTMFRAYELNPYGFSTPCYSLMLADHLYRKNGQVDSYGVKFFTSEMKPNLEILKCTRACAKKERTPGATTT